MQKDYDLERLQKMVQEAQGTATRARVSENPTPESAAILAHVEATLILARKLERLSRILEDSREQIEIVAETLAAAMDKKGNGLALRTVEREK